MNDSLWVDIALLLLFLTTVSLFLLIETGSLSGRTPRGNAINRERDGEIEPLLDNVGDTDFEVIPRRILFGRVYPQKLVRQSGLPVARSQPLYWGFKTLAAVVTALIMLEVTPQVLPWWGYVLAAAGAFFTLDVWLLNKRRARRIEISNALLFFVELLVVNLKSGFGLSQAFRNATEYGLQKGTPLARETALIASELDAGRDRRAAFADLASRTGVVEMRRLAAVIDVGFAVGAPVADALQTQAALLRSQQQQRHAALLNRKSLEATLPMLLVCFPMFMVLVFFPAGLTILEVLQLLSDVF